jgi:hypothetical protein
MPVDDDNAWIAMIGMVRSGFSEKTAWSSVRHIERLEDSTISPSRAEIFR